jgi:predicted transcriptional regulator
LTLNDIICLSEKRRDIILILGKKDCTLDEIVEQMNVPAHSFMSQLKTLRDEGIISFNDESFHLTFAGRILVQNMNPLFETIRILDQDQRYWFDRNLSIIPMSLLGRIHEIGNYTLLSYDISEYMFDVPADFLDNFKISHHAMCLLSVYHPVYTEK